MPTFTDARGRTWPVQITVGTLRRGKALGVDLAGAVGPKGDFAKLFADPEAFVSLLLLLLGAELKAAGLGEDEFLEAVDGPTIERATLAFLEAVADFTRPSLAKAMTCRLREVVAAETAAAEAAILAAPWPSASGSAAPSGSGPTPTPSGS